MYTSSARDFMPKDQNNVCREKDFLALKICSFLQCKENGILRIYIESDKIKKAMKYKSIHLIINYIY